MGVGQLLVLVEVQHGQRDVEVLALGADVVGRTEAAVLLDLEVVVDEAGPRRPPSMKPSTQPPTIMLTLVPAWSGVALSPSH